MGIRLHSLLLLHLRLLPEQAEIHFSVRRYQYDILHHCDCIHEPHCQM
jgi:hypothetical protein